MVIKIIYWTTTILIFLFDGVVPALTSNTELARQGISHLQYPDYFRLMLTFFKVIGALALVLPPAFQQTALAKFKDQNSLYLPIPNADILLDPNLVQNPFYK